VFGATDGRELHDSRRDHVHPDRPQDQRRFGSGDTQLRQLRGQRLLNREEQQWCSIALVCDGEQMLPPDQRRALRAGQRRNAFEGRVANDRQLGHLAQQPIDQTVEQLVPTPICQ
jgi:hypothetical protein